MKMSLAGWSARAIALAFLLFLSLPARSALTAGADGAWQPLSGPFQNGGAMALDDVRHCMYTWGGDHTDMVRKLPLNWYPYSWEMIETTGTPPPIRSGHTLLFDAQRDRLIVFGGRDTAGQALNDVWQLTLGANPTWSELAAYGSVPDPRDAFGACFVPGSSTMFVFGGLDNDGNVLGNDLYALNLASNPPYWYVPSQSGDIPSGRYSSPLTLDPANNRLLLFGGNDGQSDLADEYEIDLATYEWTTQPMSGITPEARREHVCTFDQNASKLLVWGGTAADDSLRALDMNTRQWSSLSCFIGPPTRGGGPSLGVFDPVWDELVVLAGQRGAEAWTFRKAAPDNFWYWTGPMDYVVSGTVVVDHAHSRMIAYGGTNTLNMAPRSDFWEFAFHDPIGWNGVNTGGIPAPARTGHVAVWDDNHDRMLVIGGRDDSFALTNTVHALQDSADFMNWQALSPAGMPPSPRNYATGIYDPEGDRVLYYGGLDNSGFLSGLYQLSLSSTPTWSAVSATGGPGPRGAATAIYDAPRHRMILFGGAGNDYKNDVWALNLPGLTWTQLHPTGTPPAGRWKHTAVFDAKRNRMVVFGGRTTSSIDANDAWALDLASATPAWTQLASTGYLPMGRSEAGAAYDFIGDRMLIYGGVSLVFSNLAMGQQDLWSLQFGGSYVAGVTPPNSQADAASDPGLAVSPNPFNGRALFTLAAPAGSAAPRASLDLYDVRGCRVARLFEGMLEAGESRVFGWDGTDDNGRPVGSGTYLARAIVGNRAVTTRIAIVR